MTYRKLYLYELYVHAGLSTGAIIGIVIGCLINLGFVIIIFTILYVRKRRKTNLTPPVLTHLG